MRPLSFLLLAAPLVILAACATPPIELPTYEVDTQRLLQTPPAPVAAAPSDRASHVVIDDVRITPETAVGYDDLPASITQLFDSSPLELSVADVVIETLANNHEIQIQGYSLRIDEYEIPVQKGIYDLMLNARAEFSRIEEQTSTSSFASTGINSTRRRQFLAGLSQLFPTGATLDLGYAIARSTNLFSSISLAFLPGIVSPDNPLGLPVPMFSSTTRTDVQYRQSFTAALTQPLLRGFGPAVTNANIRIAQLERQGSAADFQTQVEETLLLALETYWQLIEAIELHKVAVVSYSAAADLLRVNRARYDAGVLPLTDVLQAEAAVGGRRVDVINARRSVRELEDRLKQILLLQPDAPLWEAQLRPSQPFAWREIDVDLEESIDVALDRRAEIRRATSNIDQADVQLQVARNNLLPRLDLIGEVESSGLDDDGTGAYRTAKDGKYISYTAALQFSYPLQNRAARYRHRQARAQAEMAGENLQAVVDRVALDVRNAVRLLRTARERIDVTQSQVRAAQALLDAELKRLDVGVSTAFQVLQFQEDLAEAQANHLRAVVDYNRAAIRLERARGTLLDTYGVHVVGAELMPAVEPVVFPIGFN